jgi:hypothetical protein
MLTNAQRVALLPLAQDLADAKAALAGSPYRRNLPSDAEDPDLPAKTRSHALHLILEAQARVAQAAFNAAVYVLERQAADPAEHRMVDVVLGRGAAGHREDGA